MKPWTDSKSASETGPISKQDAAAAAIAKFAANLDPEYPSAIVSGGGPAVDEPADQYGQPRAKPDFVSADDAGWETAGQP